jgi:hypothetical protein
MQTDFNFFKTIMPGSRKADFYLGCLDGAVFLDFNLTNEKLIYLRRISFDGYGCCNIENATNILNEKSSNRFLEEIKKGELDQENITTLVREIIKINKDDIWIDAILEYGLIDEI